MREDGDWKWGRGYISLVNMHIRMYKQQKRMKQQKKEIVEVVREVEAKETAEVEYLEGNKYFVLKKL